MLNERTVGNPFCSQTLSSHLGEEHSFLPTPLSSHRRCHPSCHVGGEKTESLPRHGARGLPLGESFVLTLKPTLPPLLCTQPSPLSLFELGLPVLPRAIDQFHRVRSELCTFSQHCTTPLHVQEETRRDFFGFSSIRCHFFFNQDSPGEQVGVVF